MEDMECNLKRKKVLLVDDCEINLFIIKSALEEFNIETWECTSGFDAIEILKNSIHNFFDLILMDIQMPVMDGIETSKKIRELNRIDFKKIPIIAISATYPKNQINELIKNGINDFISKPIDFNIFRNKLNSIMN